MVRILSDIQLSIGGFYVCFDVQLAHVRSVWVSLLVGNDIEEDYLLLVFFMHELNEFVGFVHVSDEFFKSFFRVWPN